MESKCSGTNRAQTNASLSSSAEKKQQQNSDTQQRKHGRKNHLLNEIRYLLKYNS